MFRSPQKGGRRPSFALVPLPCPPSSARCAARPSGGRRRWHRLPPVSCPSAGTDRTILTQKALKFLRLHRHAPQPVKGRPLLSWRLPVIQRFLSAARFARFPRRKLFTPEGVPQLVSGGRSLSRKAAEHVPRQAPGSREADGGSAKNDKHVEVQVLVLRYRRRRRQRGCCQRASA